TSYSALEFVERTTESNYIYFVPESSGCWVDSVGNTGGVVEVHLGTNCSTGSTIHEILHTLGMHHEQNRCDRDSYVTVNWSNIGGQSAQYQYEKVCDGYETIGPYDEASIMHYGRNQGSIGGSGNWQSYPTMTSLRGRDSWMGQRDGLSSGDIDALFTM